MKNRFELNGETVTVFLRRKDGDLLETIIDAADLERAKAFPNSWCASWSSYTNSFYCLGSVTISSGKKMTVPLHRWVTNCSDDLQVDHFNNDTLDNRRSNLRIASRSENMQNRAGLSSNNTSGVRGVSWEKDRGLWRAEVRVNGKRIRIGRFDDLHEAEFAVSLARAKHMPFSKEARKEARA